MATDPDATLGRVVRERIAERRKWRRWYRANERLADWTDIAADNDAQLRALLRLLREARRRPERERVGLAADLSLGDHFAGMPR